LLLLLLGPDCVLLGTVLLLLVGNCHGAWLTKLPEGSSSPLQQCLSSSRSARLAVLLLLRYPLAAAAAETSKGPTTPIC
jgi:hypothetical protein